jgi:hypothetical protein
MMFWHLEDSQIHISSPPQRGREEPSTPPSADLIRNLHTAGMWGKQLA